jgi:hypothetical protein
MPYSKWYRWIQAGGTLEIYDGRICSPSSLMLDIVGAGQARRRYFATHGFGRRELPSAQSLLSAMT